MIRFHFPCIALCEIDVWTDGDDQPVPEESSARILGIYPPDVAQPWMNNIVAVSLDRIEGDSLDAIEENIKAAALLQWQGFGRPVAA